MDRDVARPALHDAVGERHAGERGDRPDLHRQLGHVADHRAVRLQEPAPVAQHRRREPDVRAEPARSRPTPSATSGTQDADNGFRPAGEFELSSTTVERPRGLQRLRQHDHAQRDRHAQPHDVPRAERRAACSAPARCSGPGASTTGTRTAPPPDRNMQQATLNLLADMGAQPATLQSGPVAATASTDTHRADLDAQRSLDASSDGSQVTISGTASDTGGGVVAGVEVSTDGGTTWHPATGTTSWTYSVDRPRQPHRRRSRSRAVDDSGNLADARRRRHGQRQLPVLALGHEHPGARRRRRLRRPDGGRGRSQVQGRHASAPSPACASTRPRPTPARTSAACGAPTAAPGPGHVHRRDGLRLADRHLRHAGPGHAGHDLRRLLLRAQRPLRGDGQLLLPQSRARAQRRRHVVDSAAAARASATPARRQRRLQLQRLEHLPGQLLRRGQLLGRRRSSRRPRRPARSPT